MTAGNRWFATALAVIFVGSLVAAWMTSGNLGLISLALGLIAGGFSLVATILLMGLMKQGSTNAGASKSGGILAVGMFLLKVPILIWLILQMYELGDPAPTLFMLGFAMVYCALVGWALTAR